MLINTGNISRKVLSKVLRSFDKNFERLQKPKEEVEELKKVLGVKSYREVGEKTFEYYKDAEC